jgi:hypothetical protein
MRQLQTFASLRHQSKKLHQVLQSKTEIIKYISTVFPYRVKRNKQDRRTRDKLRYLVPDTHNTFEYFEFASSGLNFYRHNITLYQYVGYMDMSMYVCMWREGESLLEKL